MEDIELPILVPKPSERYFPFPLTDIQQAYWVGRNEAMELGGVSTHYYNEVDCCGLDMQRLTAAWNQVIDRHDMLRAVVLPIGQQQVLEKVATYEIVTLDLRNQDSETVATGLAEVRNQMSHLVLPSDQWPLFEIRATLIGEQNFRLHLSFDALTVDARSRNLVLREWSQLYQDVYAELPPLELTFRDFILAEVSLKETSIYQQAEAYWDNRVASLPPPPELTFAKSPARIFRSRFTRLQGELNPATWARLQEYATLYDLRPSALLLTAFSECLKLWCKSPHMTLNLTLFNKMARDNRLAGVVGDFTSTLLLAIDNEAEDTFVSRALCIQKQLEKDLFHSALSGVQVIRKLFQHQRTEFGALMPVVFTSLLSLRQQTQNSAPTEWLGESVFAITQTPQVALDHQVREIKGALVYEWDVVEELFSAGMLQDMMNCYTGFLKRLAEDEQAWQAHWPDESGLLLPESHRKLYDASNATGGDVPMTMLHELFLQQFLLRPSQLAVVSPNRKLTYAELADYSKRVGSWLRNQGALPNNLVAVVMEKGWHQVVAVLGVLQSGAAYVPVDPTLPKERLWYLLEQTRAKLVITQPCFDEIIEWPADIQRLIVGVDNIVLQEVDDPPPYPLQKPEDLAYVIFTSGSSGQPKGVMMDHRAVVNTILDINQRFNVQPADRVLALSSLSFDLSVYDIFGTLAAGGTIIIPNAAEAQNPAYWADLIAQQGVTIWNSVPALMNLLVECVSDRSASASHHLLASLRLVMMSGDWIPVSLPGQIKELVGGVEVVSLGGATEAAIWSILYPIEKVDPVWKSIPYGKPMVNQQFHVLNEVFGSCPIWVPGQLYIGGIGLAKGYWRDEDKSRASFITHPRTGERLYRTGDLGRYLPDGNIEFIGREDFQVKIQGYRVELGEIEAALEQNRTVQAAIVNAAGKLQGEKRLIAYIVAASGHKPIASDLRHYLKQKLPDYMVPNSYVTVDKFSLSRNGKLDRNALPVPSSSVPDPSQETIDATSSLTGQIIQLISRVLVSNNIAPDSHLLNLGATSIDMIRITNQLDSELDFRPNMADFYRHPTALWLTQTYLQRIRSYDAATPPASSPEASETFFKQLTDPAERVAFKQTQPGLRRDDEDKLSIQLVSPKTDESIIQKYARRRSHRQFVSEPIELTQFSQFLSSLYQIQLNDEKKYLYASAGGLYPVQTYLYIKPGRVENLVAGPYYYHPVDHRLIQMSANAEFDRDAYDPLVNRPIFDQAAFAILFIAQISAIAPMYAEHSRHFSTLEAGLMAQLLEHEAPASQIGLCQIGHLDFERIRSLFDLDKNHILIHSLLGGRIELHRSWVPFQESYEQANGSGTGYEEGEI